MSSSIGNGSDTVDGQIEVGSRWVKQKVGAHAKTPDNWGYHAKCRFDTDNFDPQYLGPNQCSLVLPIQEIN